MVCIIITDIARYKDPERTDYLVRNRNTIEFLGISEQLNNPDFNPIEFDRIRKQAGLNSFILTSRQWIVLHKSFDIIPCAYTKTTICMRESRGKTY